MRAPHVAIIADFAALTGCSSFSATIVKADDAGVGGSSSAGGTTAAGTSTSGSIATSTMGGLTSAGGTTATAAGNSSTAGGTTATAGSNSTMGGTFSGGTQAVGGITNASGASTSTVGGSTAIGDSTSATGGTGISTGSTAPIDAGTGATGGCDLSQPFGTPFQVVPSSLTSGESGLSVSADGLTAIAGINPSTTGSNYDLKMYTRSSVTVAFGNQQELPGASNINTSNTEASPRLSRDGLNLFYTSCHPGGCSLYLVTRTSPNASFGTCSPLPSTINIQSSEGGAWISPDNADFYWVSANVIYHATISGGVFANAAPVSELSLGENQNRDTAPVLTDDQLTLYLASDRAAATNADSIGYLRIWRSTRASIAAPWNALSLVSELDQGAGTDGGNYTEDVSADGCIIYFSSRVGNQVHLFQASKP